MEQIEEVFEELNYPSAARLKRVLKDRGIDFDAKAVDELVKGESTRQVQAPAPLLTGKIAAKDLNDVWFADLIDLTAAPSVGAKVDLGPTEEGEKYILVAQDVFSRRIFARALKNKRPPTVLAAFQDILDTSGERPKQLTVDKGGEFQATFQTFIESQGMKFVTKDNLRQIATLDVAIGYLKKAMARDARKAKTDDWADRLSKVVRGQNLIPNESYLDGAAPASVPGNADLVAKLVEKNRGFIEENRDQVETREKKLREAGYFRVLLDRPMNFARGFKPKWSTKVHRVVTVDFDVVIDEDGRKYKTKFALPVAASSREDAPVRLEGGGSEQTEAKRRRLLGELANQVEQEFGIGTTVSLARVGQFLKRVSLDNFRRLALEARLNMQSPIANFLRVFPDKFTIRTGSGQALVRIRPPVIPGRRRLRRIPGS